LQEDEARQLRGDRVSLLTVWLHLLVHERVQLAHGSDEVHVLVVVGAAREHAQLR